MEILGWAQTAATPVTLLAAMITAYVHWKNGGNARPDKLRKRYEFAKECLPHITDEKTDLLTKELGYLALAETDDVSPYAIEYILRLPEAARSLGDYLSAHELLTFDATATPQLSFRNRKSARRRKFDRRVLFWSGAVLYVIPTIPVLGIVFRQVSPALGYSIAGMFAIPLWWGTWVLWKAYRKRLHADHLVKRQSAPGDKAKSFDHPELADDSDWAGG